MSVTSFVKDSATTEIYTLSLHDALPIWDVSMDLVFRNDQTLLVNLRGIGYTPLLPDGLTITEQWRSIPRVPLRDRPRTILGKRQP